MSTISRVNSKVDITIESRFDKLGSNLDATSNNSDDGRKEHGVDSNKGSPGRSRYGRAIKPKSPKNEDASSPKACYAS